MFWQGAKSVFDAFFFISSNFVKIKHYIFLPLLTAILVGASLVWASFELLSYLTGSLNSIDGGFFVSTLQITLKTLGIFLGLILAYLLFVPTTKLFLGLFLGLFAEKVYQIKTNKTLDNISFLSKQSLKNTWFSTKIALGIFAIQVPVKILALILLLFFPGGFLLAIFMELFVNYLFVHYDCFSCVFIVGKSPTKTLRELKTQMRHLDSSLTGFRLMAAIVLSLPFINVFAMLINTVAAVLLVQKSPNK